MAERYDHGELDAKWQRRWQESDVFHWRNDPARPKYYVLEMFPYTSGRLHIGHVRNYTMGDTLARMQRARGFDVLYPMGWDAFGLPAENAAISSGIHPRTFTDDAVASMKAAMHRLGLSYDWRLELNTSAPDYIRAQQKLFLRCFERGLIYRDTSFVNWCNSCRTVLANEQAAGGRCWRCHNAVVKRRLPQWFFNIRAYADELLDAMADLKGWPASVINIQETWIGRSFGVEVDFRVEGMEEVLPVFTTRVDTLAGCTFMVLAPEHRLLDDPSFSAGKEAEIAAFREQVLMQPAEDRAKLEQEKLGLFTGRHAVNPLTGESIPIHIANYVLMDYGTGAVMAVPGHDERDFEFARKYHLPIRRVILGPGQDPAAELTEAYADDGVLVNSGAFDGLDVEAGAQAIADRLEAEGRGRRSKQFRLQNWSVSRQRYWGNPIPVVHCGACGVVPLPESALPVLLPPEIVTQGSGSPLSRVPDFVETTCPKCGGPAQRDTDTMDTFVDSSWYPLRYPTPGLDEPFDTAIVDRMLPADVYIGGVEHATLHLIYSRFITKVLRDLGMLHFDEPFQRLYNQGMVNDIHGRKQSKSLGNVVEPTAVIDAYGADSLRIYLLFKTSYNAPINWEDSGPRTAQTWLARVWRLVERFAPALEAYPGADLPDPAVCATGAERALRAAVHEAIGKVTQDVENFQFNTAIAALMTLTNALYTYPEKAAAQPAAAAVRVLIRLLGPFAPHIGEEMWAQTGGRGLLAAAPWPRFEADALVTDTREIAVQVNGKFVTSVLVKADLDQQQVFDEVIVQKDVARRVGEKQVRRVVYVPNRLININAA